MEHTDSFGYWVMRRRKALDLTRAELAGRVGCAVETIKKIERDERRPSRQVAELLAQALGLPAEEQPLFLQVALQARPVDRLKLPAAPLVPPPAQPHNLPAPTTSFVGRQQDIAELQAALARPEARLCTILGPGGMGKTRLALEAASQLVERYAGGVWLVELAGISNPRLVGRQAAIALGIPERRHRDAVATLVDFFRSRPRSLLVLDNCEHLVDACAELCAALLRGCLNLQILATSRQALGAPGEVIRPLSGLPAEEMQPRPPADEDHAAAVPLPDAVRLFVERGRLVRPGFRLDAASAPAVAQICRELDGMPLAIELAAARMNVLSPAEIAARLAERFELLAAPTRTVEPRHRALQAVVRWSYQLLDEVERHFFDRLSVFRGSFSLAAAEAVAGERGDAQGVLDLLASLVDKSMVLADVDAPGGTRYRLLETLRLFGQERLAECGEQEAIAQRHALYYQRFAEETDPELRGQHQVTCLNILAANHDNLRAALEWAAAHDAAVGLRLASALWWFWITLGYFQEGMYWLEHFTNTAQSGPPEPESVRAYVRYAFLASFVLSDEQLRELAGEGLRLSRALGDREGTAMSLLLIAGNPYYTADVAKARALYEESLALFREAGDAWGTAWDALMLAQLLEVRQQDYATARRLVEEAMAISRRTGDVQGIASAYFRLGELERHTGNYELARWHYEAGFTYLRQLNNRYDMGIVMWSLGAMAGRQGDYGEAVKLREVALQLFRDIHQEEMTVQVLGELGYFAFLHGEHDRAIAYCEESLRIAEESDSQRALLDTHLALGEVALARSEHELARREFCAALSTATTYSLPPANCVYALEALARLALAESDPETAAVLLGAAEAIHTPRPFLLFPRTVENWQQSLDAVRAHLSAAAFDAAQNRGRCLWQMGEQHLLAYAKGERRTGVCV